MSKFKSLFKLVRYGLAVISVAAVAAWSQGVPTTIDIWSFADLQKIGKDPAYPLSGIYELRSDINMEPGWEPIGKWRVYQAELDSNCPPIDYCHATNMFYGANKAFTGTFLGNGHTIRELRINIINASDGPAPLITSVGLFGALDGALVNNLTIEAGSVNIAGFQEISAGILAGISRNPKITNVSVSGTVSAASVSGNSSAAGSTGAIAGGLVGIVEVKSDSLNILGGIYKSHAAVVLSGNGVSAGGLVGENRGGTINQSSARVSGTNINFLNTGGLVGVNYETHPADAWPKQQFDLPRIFQSYSEVNMNWSNPMSSSASIGGLVGAHNVGLIQNSYSVGTLTGNTGAGVLGGFAGTIGRLGCQASITTSYAAVTLGEAQHIGGFLGEPLPCTNVEIIASNSYWDINVSGVTTSSDVGELGKTTAEMMQKSTFVNWWDHDLWQIDEGNSYPYLAWQDGGSSSISRGIASNTINRNNFAPTATIRGKTLNVKTSSPANLQVQLIDMRGRTLVRFTTEGNGGSFSLNKVSAGRYFVEMRDVASGRRFTSSVVVR